LDEQDELYLHLKVSYLQDDSPCVLAGTDSKDSGRKKICFEWSKINCSVARLADGAFDHNQWQLVMIGCGMEYACGVKSETIKLNSIVPLWYA
jgi:hypothetical protein